MMGVQTCALPIYGRAVDRLRRLGDEVAAGGDRDVVAAARARAGKEDCEVRDDCDNAPGHAIPRSTGWGPRSRSTWRGARNEVRDYARSCALSNRCELARAAAPVRSTPAIARSAASAIARGARLRAG